MHQKHPPAKTAVRVCDGDEFCSAATSAIENDRTAKNIGFIAALILYLPRHVERSRDVPMKLPESYAAGQRLRGLRKRRQAAALQSAIARDDSETLRVEARLKVLTILLRGPPSCGAARRASGCCGTFRTQRASACRSWVRRWIFRLRNGATVPEKKFPRHRAVDQARREGSPQRGENRKRAGAARGHFIGCPQFAA